MIIYRDIPGTKLKFIIWWALHFISHAWGPVTHLYICSLAGEGSSSGCNSPDVLKVAWPELHSLEFAAELFWHAHNSTNHDLIEFALGFGCHVSSDLVGHHANGFLNPPSADHEIEFNVDSMIFHERLGKRLNVLKKYYLSEQEVDLILKASSTYYTVTKSSMKRNLRRNLTELNHIDRTRIESAINRYNLIVSTENALIRLQPSFMNKFELQQHSFCLSNNFHEVEMNFNASAEWAVSTCMFWKKSMWALVERGDIGEAGSLLRREVDELFRSNNGTSCIM